MILWRDLKYCNYMTVYEEAYSIIYELTNFRQKFVQAYWKTRDVIMLSVVVNGQKNILNVHFRAFFPVLFLTSCVCNLFITVHDALKTHFYSKLICKWHKPWHNSLLYTLRVYNPNWGLISQWYTGYWTNDRRAKQLHQPQTIHVFSIILKKPGRTENQISSRWNLNTSKNLEEYLFTPWTK